mgnify:CR=1 FL=1
MNANWDTILLNIAIYAKYAQQDICVQVKKIILLSVIVVNTLLKEAMNATPVQMDIIRLNLNQLAALNVPKAIAVKIKMSCPYYVNQVLTQLEVRLNVITAIMVHTNQI